MTTIQMVNGRDRIVVSTSRCGRDNPGSNPGHGNCRDSVSWKTIYILLSKYASPTDPKVYLLTNNPGYNCLITYIRQNLVGKYSHYLHKIREHALHCGAPDLGMVRVCRCTVAHQLRCLRQPQNFLYKLITVTCPRETIPT